MRHLFRFFDGKRDHFDNDKCVYESVLSHVSVYVCLLYVCCVIRMESDFQQRIFSSGMI